MSQTISLQRKLIKTSLLSSVAAGLLALALLLGWMVVQTMQVQDELMDEVADMLLAANIHEQSDKQVDQLSESFDLSYQLKSGGQLLAQSEHDDQHVAQYFIQLQSKDSGYSFLWQNGHLWRAYVQHEADENMQVYVLQPVSERFEVILNSLLSYSGILLLLWFLQWGFLHILIKREFKVIHQFSQKIAQKHAADLSPIRAEATEMSELQPIRLQLNSLMQRLDQALTAEQRFTADASHELRSPLSAIQLRLQVLKRKYSGHPQLAQEMNSIQQDVTRGTKVLENLLLLARLDPSNAAELPKEMVDIQALSLKLRNEYASQAEEKNISFECDIAAGQLFANKELIQICLRNLIDNALRYTEAQGKIVIRSWAEQQQVIWQIENTGQGLTDEVIERLGERFYRVLGTQVRGNGLGLSICKKIVQLHLGTLLFAQSELGGLKVTIKI
ncbi:sensor histidine kinase [Acinetobacter tianfuensis]|uniref:histidine kinase n=1 Tax=Acinetobacter tianfuensis TaxID=2419603 RepID=A0A3A8EM66_9GAMM|nr:HAMP domain-containing sensor histidine kinase [Acinetobacter tianfuensis]RKG31054.1 sensor histidine kinase [Acinetobacter tianfuensis]